MPPARLLRCAAAAARAAHRAASRPPCAPAATRAMAASTLHTATSAAEPPVLAVNVYISEGRNDAVLAALQAAAGPACVHVFRDEPYNRTGFTLASARADTLHAGVVALSREALARVDLTRHVATHPRLGVVDHVSVHALPAAEHAADDAAAAAAAAAALARRVGATLAAPPDALPVYFYGAAATSAVTSLADVRRALGYFDTKSTVGGGGGSGALGGGFHAPPGAPPPDAGPRHATPAAGVACVGALPWVVNYNLLLVPIAPGGADADAAFFAAAKRVAAAVSARRGGPPGVQALALRHAGGFEVACNLLEAGAPHAAGDPPAVAAAAAAAAAREGLRVADAYCTNVEPAVLIARGRAADAAALAQHS